MTALTDYLKERVGNRVEQPHGPRLAARQGRELARHRRPQADRDPLHRHRRAVLRDLRVPRAPDPHPARAARRRRRHGQLVQRGRDDARDGDGLLRRRPDPRWPRQLPRAPDDRRAGHGVPAPQRALVLALRLRRAHLLLLVPRGRRRRQHRLDGLSAALARRPGERPGPVDPLAPHHDALVDGRGDQLHRHDPQHAHPRDVVDAHPAVRLVDRDLLVAPAARAARALGRADAAAARAPVPGHVPLLPARGHRPAAGRPSSSSTSSGSSGTPRSTS